MKVYFIVMLMVCATNVSAMLTKNLISKVLLSKQLQSCQSLNQMRSISNAQRAILERKMITHEQREIDKLLRTSASLTSNEIKRLQDIQAFQQRSINGLHWRHATVANHSALTALSPNKQLIAMAESINGGYGYFITVEKIVDEPFKVSIPVVDIKEIQFLLFNGNDCIVLKGKTYTNTEITKYIEAVPKDKEQKWLEKLLPASIVSLWIASYAYDILKIINA